MPDLALAIPIIIFMIPIIAILTHHQRKMAELIHRPGMQPQLPNPEIDALRREVQELKSLIHQQAITLDTLNQRMLSQGSDVSQRLGS